MGGPFQRGFIEVQAASYRRVSDSPPEASPASVHHGWTGIRSVADAVTITPQPG